MDDLDSFARFHPRWFDTATGYSPTTEHLDIFKEEMPSSWTCVRREYWYVARCPVTVTPDQGWKLHICSPTRDSTNTLRAALRVLQAETAAFKFLLDPYVTSLFNGKLWSRSSSGKFITVYPESDTHFYYLGERLTLSLRDFVGPYILSDQRWPGSRCVSYRYGGFRSRHRVRIDGTRELLIAAPNGQLVADTRSPFWNPPSWLSTTETSVTDASGGVGSSTLQDGRYLIDRPLSFSNRGGVYKALDRKTGRVVVIKEARPCVEVGRHRLDAIELLRKEHRLLVNLSGHGSFVDPIDFFSEWEHAYLVEGFIEGDHLGRFTILNNPLYSRQVTSSTVSAYLKTMHKIWLQLAKAIDAAHSSKIILGDLSFTNVIICDDQSIRIFDLEAAMEFGVDAQVGLYTPGLISKDSARVGTVGFGDDHFSLGAIMFGSIMMATGITGLYPPAMERFLSALQRDISLPDDLVFQIRDLMGVASKTHGPFPLAFDMLSRLSISSELKQPRLVARLAGEESGDPSLALRHEIDSTVRKSIQYFRGTAQLERKDRLFPADTSIFQTNPLSVAYGASGVFHALYIVDGNVPEEYVKWFLDHRITCDDYSPGLYSGQAGIAWVLDEIGYEDIAITIIRDARSCESLWNSANVLHGSAGFGLASLRLWKRGRGDEFLTYAVEVGNHLIKTVIRSSRGAYWNEPEGNSPAVGYATGSSGVSLFLLYLHLATGDQSYLELGRSALDFDLSHATWIGDVFAGFPDRSISTTEASESSDGVTLRCYWDFGSAGIGTTVVRYLAVAPDQILRDMLNHIAIDACRKYTVFPQLFHGLAGLGNFLIDLWELDGDPKSLRKAWTIAEGVQLFRIECEEGIVFPGEQSRRECADYATGSAGVILFLNRLLCIRSNTRSNFNFVLDELLPQRSIPLPGHLA